MHHFWHFPKRVRQGCFEAKKNGDVPGPKQNLLFSTDCIHRPCSYCASHVANLGQTFFPKRDCSCGSCAGVLWSCQWHSSLQCSWWLLSELLLGGVRDLGTRLKPKTWAQCLRLRLRSFFWMLPRRLHYCFFIFETITIHKIHWIEGLLNQCIQGSGVTVVFTMESQAALLRNLRKAFREPSCSTQGFWGSESLRHHLPG